MQVVMQFKFYIEYDEVHHTWDVWEWDGGHDADGPYDKLLCECYSKELADKVHQILTKEYNAQSLHP